MRHHLCDLVMIWTPEHCRTVRLNDLDCPVMSQTIRNAQNRNLHLVTYLLLIPALEVVMVTFRVSPLLGVLSTTTFLQVFLLFLSAFRASSVMISLPLSLSVALGRIRINDNVIFYVTNVCFAEQMVS
jgi:hypothetical protein